MVRPMCNAIRLGLTRYVDFRGRSTRSEYWWFALFFIVVVYGAMFLSYGADVQLLWLPFWLGLIIPFIAVSVRRLHDTGRSGAWFLLGFVPFGGFVLLYFYTQPGEPHDNRHGPATSPTALTEVPETA
jgi:uncharacterized membrane protein YhaH (DUF805 family)